MSAGTDMSETDSIPAQNSAAHGGCPAANKSRLFLIRGVRNLFAEWTRRDASFRSVRRMMKPEVNDEFVTFCGSRGTARLGVRVIEVSSMEVRCIVESGNAKNRERQCFEVNGFTIGNYRRNIFHAVKWGHFRFFPANDQGQPALPEGGSRKQG